MVFDGLWGKNASDVHAAFIVFKGELQIRINSFILRKNDLKG